MERTVLSLIVPLMAVAFAQGATAQERRFEPIPVTPDVKTAPEPVGVLRPAEARPVAPAQGTRPAPRRERAESQALPADYPGGRLGIDHTRMHFDEPGDGSLWARGAHYKASFDASGMTCYPLFGLAQPEHFPHRFSPDRVTLGGDELDVACSSRVRVEDRVELDRGLFVEVYDFAPGSFEQTFTFRALPGSGDLVVRIPVGSALATTEEPGGLSFRSEFGHLTYGRAVAIDAHGRRTDAPTRLEDGAITIRVEAAFLAQAALPLVIDPVVSTFPIDTTSFSNFAPKVAYDATTNHWIAVYHESGGGGDVDVYFSMMDANGNGIWSGYVNSNTEVWDDAEVANLAGATQFLVVSDVSNSVIKGRRVEAEALSLSAEFTISGSEQGSKRWPAVGGDPYAFGGAFYCVAYERLYDVFSDWDIVVRLVGADGSVQPAIFLSNSGGTLDTAAAVSRSNGGSTWTIAWNRLAGTDSQVWAGRVRFDGLVVNTPFLLSGLHYDDYVHVSSPLVGSQRTMVVYQRYFSTDSDIVATVLDGGTILEERNLSGMDAPSFLDNQTDPTVDSDGQHFVVTYGEDHAGTSTDVIVSDFHLADGHLGLSQTHVVLDAGPTFEGRPEIVSRYSGGGANRRFLVAWQEAAVGHSDVRGALFDGVEGGPVQTACPGDGTNGACPCGNNGGAGRGCANSVVATGARLTLTGTASTWNDTAQLVVTGVPPTAACFFLMSPVTAAPVPLGDGLSCLGGTIQRMGSRTASGGTTSFPNLPGSQLHSYGLISFEGGTRLYQVWYRNAAAFCTPSTFNVSNGVLVTWAR